MAKKAAKKGVNKSEKIREAATAIGSKSPKEIVAHLAAKKITVSPALVSNVLTKSGTVGKSKKAKRKASRKAGRKVGHNGTSHGLNLNSLLSANRLVRDAGGIEQAQAALSAIAKLQG